MPTATAEKYTSTEEAIKGAGTTRLSHLTSNARILTRDEVKEHEEDLNLIGQPVLGAHRAYAGPYTDLVDARNAWTASQDMGELNRTKDAMPPEPDAKKEPVKAASTPTPRTEYKK